MANTYCAMVQNSIKKVVAFMTVDPDKYSTKYYTPVPMKDDIYCVKGMYYNFDDGLFYDDEAYTTINGEVLYEFDSTGEREHVSV